MSDTLIQIEPKKTLTASDIRLGMSVRWSQPEYAIMWEVAPATGAATGRIRYADAVIMSLWPSRGQELHGVEIKISRSDWMRESKDPTKAERIAAYCDRWYVHTTPGVIRDLSEVPPAWGVREFDGKRWSTLREAALTEAKPTDRGFLAALLRRADEGMRGEIANQARRMTEAQTEAYEKRVAEAVEHVNRERGFAQKTIAEFEEASGLNKRDVTLGGAKQIGRLVKLVSAAGVNSQWKGIQKIRKETALALKIMDAAIAESGFDFTDEPP